MKVRLGAVATLALALMIAGTNQANASLLANPGFEDAVAFVDDGNGVGKWNPFAGGVDNTSEVGSTMPRTGANAAELNLLSDGGFAGFFQDVPAVPGADIDWSVWAKDALGNGGAAIEMRIEYQAAGSEIARTGNLVPTLTGTDYELVTLSDVVPAGADTARVVFAIQSFGVASPQSVYVDDAMVNTIPEPTTVAMIGLAGLALAARRRS